MVGKRPRGQAAARDEHSIAYRGDVESSPKTQPLERFRDIAYKSLGDKNRADLKRQLLDGVDGQWMQSSRKSPAELKAIPNKKVRAYYEGVNQRLNDWLEVDALVLSVAGGVLDSMNPDADRDGIRGQSIELQDRYARH